MKIKMEYTEPFTPQKNGMVDRSFTFLYNRILDMLHGYQFTKGVQQRLWDECARTLVM